MNSIGLEWLAFFMFALLIASCAASEIIWLVRRGWASGGRSAVFVLVTDLAALIASGGVMFVAMSAIFVMVMGPAGTGSNAPEWAYVLTVVVAAAAPVVLLFIFKLIGLYALKIRSGKAAVSYSALLSIIIPLIVLLPPTLFIYLLTRGR